MSNQEEERSVDRAIRWCPCVICTHRSTCDTECLRFKEFVRDENTRNRYKRWLRFLNNGGIPRCLGT